MRNRESIEKLYEKYLEDFSPSEEYKKIAKLLLNEIEELEKISDPIQIEKMKNIQNYFYEMIAEEKKQGFCEGFKISADLLR